MNTQHNIWKECLEKLSETLTEKEIRLWIAPLKVKKDGDALKLYAPNKFMKEEIEKNFLSKIAVVVNQLADNTFISLDVSSPVKTNEKARTMPSGFVSNLNSDMTFETFVEGKSNQLAKAACLSVVNEPGAFNPLYIYGGVGLGKTHLLHSIGNKLSNENKKVVYLHSEKFVQNMVTALRNNQIEEFKKFYRNLDVLLLDDIQFFAGKERSQEEFFHTFNALFEYKKQVVLTCDKYPKEINGLEDRIKSRLVWGLNVSIDPPDLETRVAILQSKAETLGMPIDNDVAFFLARNINSNVRELEGNLRRVLATARFRKCQITLDFTKETLADLISLNQRLITIEQIQKVTAGYYKIRVSDILSTKRDKKNTMPRHMAMALCKDLTNNSLPSIGDGFGGRDHTTVLHANKKIQKLRKEDSQIEQDYINIVHILNNG
uniref:Chromosomal replication initiator protein DnaA n=1 Tax=uncultured bacterium EIL5A08 TaxID=1768204 RepID=A0A0U2XU94_9BACT|nr:putative chromosomal replication initiator protein DnaA [uncultured bacterium EIL5A08]